VLKGLRSAATQALPNNRRREGLHHVKRTGQQSHRRAMVHRILGHHLESGNRGLKTFMTEFREAFPDLSVDTLSKH
jgi:hypothetical protein